MKETIYSLINYVRGAFLVRFNPKGARLIPASIKFGFDRGVPIDRYYIDSFFEKNGKLIKGKCLEIHDTHYIKKYGKRVTSMDALDVDKSNKQANIYGDLRNLKNVKSNTYDTLVITQTYGVIDEFEKAIEESKRILKPGGLLLASVSSVAPTLPQGFGFWRFTPRGAKYIFSKHFGEKNVEIESYGNLYSSQAFLVGLASGELNAKELDTKDPNYPVIIFIKAKKK